MTKNIGFMDQVIRIIFGLILLSFVFTGPQTAWGYFGLIPLVTGVFGSCPFYSLFKIQSCKLKK